MGLLRVMRSFADLLSYPLRFFQVFPQQGRGLFNRFLNASHLRAVVLERSGMYIYFFWLTPERRKSKNKHKGVLINKDNLSHKKEGLLYGSV